MFDSLLEKAAGFMPGDLTEKLGTINDSIESVKTQLPDSGLDAPAQTSILDNLQNIQKALITMPPDFQALQQNAAELQAIAQTYSDNPLAQQILAKIQPLLGKL